MSLPLKHLLDIDSLKREQLFELLDMAQVLRDTVILGNRKLPP